MQQVLQLIQAKSFEEHIILRVSSGGKVLSAFKGRTLDFTAFPRQKKSQILKTDLILQNPVKSPKEKKKIGFCIGETINLKDILSSQSTGRKKVNFTTTERVYDSSHVSQSDTIYRCENLYRCNDCRACKNSLYLDGCGSSEFCIASQRSGNSSFCIRVDDSADCMNSYNVICSAKISNSLFIQDCNSLHECIFCSHISNRKYCIVNMQFEKEEYFEIKSEIVKWILGAKKEIK